MGANLFHAFQIVTQFGGNVLRKGLTVLARLEILLTIQEPNRNLELTRILNDSDKLFNLIGGKFTSALVDIDFRLFANQVGKASADTGNFGHTKDDIALSLYVGIENTQNVLKFRSLLQ